MEIKALDETAATNPLLFPTADVVAKQHNFQFLRRTWRRSSTSLYADLSGT